MPIKRVKLNYMSAVLHTPPVARIPVSSSEMERLNISIREKCRQNAKERKASKELAEHFLVKGSITGEQQEKTVKQLIKR